MPSAFAKGTLFALSAAALNATIGVISKVLMNSGYAASSVALIKTVLGCALLSVLLVFLKKTTGQPCPLGAGGDLCVPGHLCAVPF